VETATVLAAPNVALDLPFLPVGLTKHDPGREHPDETEEREGATKWKQDVAGGIALELIVVRGGHLNPSTLRSPDAGEDDSGCKRRASRNQRNARAPGSLPGLFEIVLHPALS